jgi:predicted nucleotidyltransferase
MIARFPSPPLEPEVLDVGRQVAAIVRQATGDPAYRVFLFGSRVSGEVRERSDIDIAIEGPSSVDPAVMLEIREACEALPTLYTIDIVDFARVDPGFREAALRCPLDVEGA